MSSGSRNLLKKLRLLIEMFPCFSIETTFFHTNITQFNEVYVKTTKPLLIRDINKISAIVGNVMLIPNNDSISILIK